MRTFLVIFGAFLGGAIGIAVIGRLFGDKPSETAALTIELLVALIAATDLILDEIRKFPGPS